MLEKRAWAQRGQGAHPGSLLMSRNYTSGPTLFTYKLRSIANLLWTLDGLL